MTEKVLTGRKVFFIVSGAFALIIGVNVTMAYQAVSTFPGLETRNSYVASQSFDAERKAQLALGWDVSGELTKNRLVVSITDAQGLPVEVTNIGAILGRATNVKDDQKPAFLFNGTSYVAPVNLAPGNWNLRMVATAADGTEFRQRIVLYVRK